MMAVMMMTEDFVLLQGELRFDFPHLPVIHYAVFST
jgi:hypothetical protein